MIIETFKQSWNAIKKNKSKFATIVVLHLLFLFTISIAAYFTIIPAIEEGKKGIEIYDTVAVQNPEQPNILQKDAIAIYQSLQSMLTYFERGGIAIAIAFILINGFAWFLAQSIVRKVNAATYANIMLVSLIFTVLMQQLITSYLKTALTGINEQHYLPTGIALTVLAVITLLSYTALTLTHLPTQQLPKKILKTVVNKGHLLLFYGILNTLLIALPLYIFMSSVDSHLAIPLIAIFTTVAVVAYTKIVWLKVID